MKYVVYGILVIVMIAGCARKNPLAPAFDSGSTSKNNSNNNTDTTHITNVGPGNGKISFSTVFQSQPLKNATIKLTLLNGSTVDVGTDTEGKAYITGLDDGTYTAALQSSPGMNNPIQTKTTTITNGSSQTLSWQDNKLVSIAPLDYNYAGYSPASGCAESTSPANYSDPRYYKFGNLAETRSFKLYYDDTGDFKGPATVSVVVDGGCTYTFTPSTTGDELGTITYNIPAYNLNNTLSLNITALCYGSGIFVKNYSFAKNWSLTTSGTSLIRSGRVNTDAVNASASVSTFSKQYTVIFVSPTGNVSTSTATFYSVYYTPIGSALWTSNSANIYSLDSAVSPSMVYINKSPNATNPASTLTNLQTGQHIAPSETYSYSVSVKYGSNLIGTFSGSLTGGMNTVPVPGITY